MKSKIINLTLGLTALLALSAQAEPVAYTLNECIAIGLGRAVPVQNAMRDQEIAKAKTKKARSEALPEIVFSANYTRNDGETSPFFTEDVLQDSYSGSATLSQTLYDGGKVFSALRAAKAYRELTAQTTAQREATLARDIHLGFNRILLVQANVAVQEASIKQLEDFAEQTEQRYEVGTASEFDHLTAQVRLANERPNLIVARNDLAVAKEAFRNLIVLDEEDFELTGELDYKPFDTALPVLQITAAGARPELLIQEQSIALRREDLTRSWSGYKPSIKASAVYSQENPDRYDGTRDAWEDHWQAGLTASWTLFDGGLRRGEVLEKGLELAKEEANRDDLRRSVFLDVKAAWLTMMASREAIKGSEENVELAEKALEIAKTRYDEGLSTYLEFTDSNLSLNTARLIYFQSLEAHLRTVAQLKFAAGLPNTGFETGATP